MYVFDPKCRLLLFCKEIENSILFKVCWDKQRTFLWVKMRDEGNVLDNIRAMFCFSITYYNNYKIRPNQLGSTRLNTP